MTTAIPTCPTCGQPNWPRDLPESLNPTEIRDGRQLRARLLSVARAIVNQPVATFVIGEEPIEYVRAEDVGALAIALALLAHVAEALAPEARR